MNTKILLSSLLLSMTLIFFSCSSSNTSSDSYQLQVQDTTSSYYYETCYELDVTLTGTLSETSSSFNVAATTGDIQIYSDSSCSTAITATEAVSIPLNAVQKIYVKVVSDGNIRFTRTKGNYVFNYPLHGTFKPASWDKTFGTTGLTLSSRVGDDYVYKLYVDSNENIIVAGSCHPVDTILYTTGDSCIFKFTKNGQLDPTFGTGGQVIMDMSGTGGPDEIFDMAVDASGRYVVAGYASSSYRGYVARFNTDGTLDPTFGTSSGYTMLNTLGGLGNSSLVYGLAIQPDGKIVVTGAKWRSNYDVYLMRISEDGKTLDMGPIYLDMLGNDLARNLLIQSDGKFLVAGWSGDPRTGFLLRYTSAGDLDPTFGTGGIVTGIFGSATRSEVRSIKELSDHSILISGGMGNGSDISAYVIKLHSDGTVDTTFASNGTMLITNATGASFSVDDVLVVQTDNKILFGFGAECTNLDWPFKCKLGLARLNSDGSLDTLFGTNGMAIHEMSPGQNSLPTGLSVQSDGRVIVTGFYENGNDYDIAIYRFWP